MSTDHGWLDPEGALHLVVGVLELLLLVLVALRVRRLIRSYRRLRAQNHTPGVAARLATNEALGSRLGGILFSEISVLWYATRFTASTPSPPTGVRYFAVYRRNGYPAVVAILLVIVAVETAAAHLLLGLWTPIAAWISTILGAYSAIWIWGDFQAARLNPIASSDDGLDLNTGLRWHTAIGWSDIVTIHDREPKPDSGDRTLRMTLFGAPDFWLELREPAQAVGPFGITRAARYLGVGADAPSELRGEISTRIGETT